MIGKKLAERYGVLSELGRGGMGVVYRAFDPVLDREVAVKVVPPTSVRKDAFERFRREARLVAKLDHPGVVPVYDFGEHDGGLFFVMPLVQGSPLRVLLDSGALTRLDIAEIGAEIAKVLEYSHARGVIHRDVKPENVMVAHDPGGAWQVRVMDFGLAIDTDSDDRVTRRGALVGTPAYLSPEQAGGGKLDARSDLYSLGVLLYECFAGVPPFFGDPASVVHRVLTEAPPELERLAPGLPLELAGLVMQCLEKDPARRPTSARLIAQALSSLSTVSRPGSGIASMATLVADPSPNRIAFVGRAGEKSEVLSRYEAAAGGACQVVLVSGEPGSGKSRLLSEIASLLAPRDALVLSGRYAEHEDVGFPFHGFCELIEDWCRQSATKDANVDFGDVAERLVEIFPVLADVPPFSEVAKRGSDSSQPPSRFTRIEIFELFSRVLRRIAGDRTLCAVLEDIHNADASIALIEYLGRRLGATRTLLIGTYRPGEVGPDHPVSRLVTSTRSSGRFSRVTLGPLSAAENAMLAELVLGGPLAEDVAEHLRRATGGNPLVTIQMVQAWRESNTLVRARDGCWGAASELRLRYETLPMNIRQLMTRRIEGLGEEERNLLSLAAVLGTRFDSRDLERLSGKDSDVESRIERLESLGFLAHEPGGRVRALRFASDVVRETLYGMLTPRRRLSLHKRVAEYLEAQYARHPERVCYALMSHYRLADAPDKAVRFALQSGRLALEACCPEEVIPAVRVALEFLEDPEWSGDPQLEGEAHELAARAYRLNGDLERALVESRAASDRFTNAGAPGRAVPPLLSMAEIAWDDRRIDEARTHVERAIPAARAAGDPTRLSRLLELAEAIARARGEDERADEYRRERSRPSLPPGPAPSGDGASGFADRLGDLLLVRGDYLAAIDAYRAAREQRRGSGGTDSDLEEAGYLMKIGELAARLGRYDEALERCEAGSKLLGEGHPLLAAALAATAAVACSWAGRYADADRYVDRTRRSLDRAPAGVDTERQRAELLLQRAIGNVAVGRGRPKEAVEAFRRCLAAAQAIGDRFEASIALFNIGDAHAKSGDATNATYHFDAAFREKSALGDRWGLAWVYDGRARIELSRGNAERAFDEVRHGLALALEIADPKLRAILQLTAGAVELARDDVDAAEKDFHLALRDAEATDIAAEIASAKLGLAAVNRLRGRFAAASNDLEAGRSSAERIGARSLVANAWLERGHLSSAMGDFADAESHYQAALSILEGLGDRASRADARIALAAARTLAGRPLEATTELEQLRDEAHRSGDERHRGLALLSLAEAYLLAGETDRAQSSAEAALDAFEAIHATRQVVRTFVLLARIQIQTARFPRAEAHARAAIERCKSLGDAAQHELGRAYLAMGEAFHEAGRHADMRAAYESAERELERAGDRAALAECLVGLALTKTRDTPREAEALLRRALEFSEAIGHYLGRAQALGSLVEVLRRLGQLDEALAVCREEERVLRQAGWSRRVAINAFHFASIHYLLGDSERALEAATRNVEISGKVGSIGQLFGLELRGLLHAEAGRWDDAWTDLDLALERSERLRHAERIANVRAARATVALLQDDSAAALVELDHAERSARGVPDETIVEHGYLIHERIALIRARALLHRGEAGAARDLAQSVLTTFEKQELPIESIDARLTRLACNLSLGEVGAGEEVEALLSETESLGVDSRRAEALHLAGVAAGSEELVARAKALATELGCPHRLGWLSTRRTP
jgi:tetratricopeptide (TPR) repeat protein